MRLLIVAMANSIHVARHIQQLAGQGWDIHLFCSLDNGLIHPEMRHVTVHQSFYHDDKRQPTHNPYIQRRGISVNLPVLNHVLHTPLDILERGLRRLLRTYRPDYRVNELARLIDDLKPDVVHSIEFQHSAYLTLAARDRVKGRFPPWIVTNWGSDIYFYRHFDEHLSKIRAILAQCDYYDCECERDVRIARELGFQGVAWPPLPNAGGFDLNDVKQLQDAERMPTADRRVIVIKGGQNWSGRAQVALYALRLCQDLLRDYEIIVFNAPEDVQLTAIFVSRQTGIAIRLLPSGTSHKDMLRMYGKARVYIGLSVSDGISTSMLEAMVMGAFPIQSCAACADEWLVEGETGFIVDSEDPHIVAEALRRALTDDALVNSAAARNWQVAQARLDAEKIKSQIIGLYQQVLGS